VVIDEARFPGRQGRLLFAYLVAEQGRPVPRDELAEALWGKSPPPSWDKALTVIVSKVRSLLPGPSDGVNALTSAFGCYRLDLPDGAWVDVIAAANAAQEAEEALAAGDLYRAKGAAALAASLVQQPFLPGEEGVWVEEKRREFADLRGRALTALADAYLRSGDAPSAAKWAEQTIVLAPFRETGYRRLMEAHVAAGNRAEALQVYERCRRLLAEELGAYPSPETESVYRDLLQAPAARGAGAPLPEAPPPASPLLVVPEDEPDERSERPAPTGSRRRLRRRRVGLLVAGGCVLAAGAAAVLAVTGGGTPQARGGNEVAAIGASTGQHLSYTGVGTTPGNVVFGDGGVWVLNSDDRTITHIDPATRRVVKTFATTGEPTDLAAGDGALWVGSASAGKGLIERGATTVAVSRVDPTSTAVTNTAHLPGPSGDHAPGQTFGVSAIAVGRRAVWAVDPDGSISRIEPATGSLVARVEHATATAIAVGDAGVWFVTWSRGAPGIASVDPHTNRVGQTIPVETSSLVGIAVGAGSIWATDPFDGVIWRIDPGPKPVERTISLSFGVTQVAFHGGAVWTANIANGTVSRIDPRTDIVTTTRQLAGTPQGLAVGDGTIWASVAGGTGKGALPVADCSPVESAVANPDVLVVSDLPLQGPSVAPTLAAAVRFVLRSHAFRAGRYTVGYQSCDDSTARTQSSDFFKCASNARDFGAAKKLVAVIGPYDSPCARVEIPITNRAPAGAVAIVSPANTSPSLTRADPDGLAGEPRILYPAGVRNYFRLASPDDLQGAAQAVLAGQLGLSRVYVLSDGGAYGNALARGFRAAARHLGLTVVGSAVWNPRARSYADVLADVARMNAQGVLLAGFGSGAGGLIRTLRARFGSHLTMIAGDGFLTIPETLKGAGIAADGTYVSLPLAVTQSLTPAGRRLVAAFEQTRAGGLVPSGTYLPETLEATEIVVDAIARSDGTRASVLDQIRRTKPTSGVFGGVDFDRNGDMTPAPFTIVRITGGRGASGLAPDLRGAAVDRTVRAPMELLGGDTRRRG
jgi:DNA-binding SARP family transcriptional activator/ABC-type branched-subunit amino acid transport system substrate-binding protein